MEADEGLYDVKHPHNDRIYRIPKNVLAEFLRQNGTERKTFHPESPEVKERVKKFCEAKTLSFATPEDAEFIIESGYKIEKITVKSNKVSSTTFRKQLFCLNNKLSSAAANQQGIVS